MAAIMMNPGGITTAVQRPAKRAKYEATTTAADHTDSGGDDDLAASAAYIANNVIVRQLFVRQFGLVHHQLASYEFFVHTIMPTLLTRDLCVQQNYVIHIRNLRYRKPHQEETGGTKPRVLTPDECKIRRLSYLASMVVDVSVTQNGAELHEKQSIIIGQMPVMIGSSLCHQKCNPPNLLTLDYGGEFELHGLVKQIISQERVATNKIMLFELHSCQHPTLSCEMRCEKMYCSPVMVTIQMRVMPNRAPMPIVVPLAHVRRVLPLVAVLRALVPDGADCTDEALCRMVNPSRESCFDLAFIPSLQEGRATSTRALARSLLFEGASAQTKIIDIEILPHITSNAGKLSLLVLMTHHILSGLLGRRALTDRDSHGVKAIDTAGSLLTYIAHTSVNRFTRHLTTECNRMLGSGMVLNPTTLINRTMLTVAFTYCIGTGNWTCRSIRQQVGLSQTVSNQSALAKVANCRRLNRSIDRTLSRITGPRLVDKESRGRICCNETPEGQPCGLVNALALGSVIAMPLEKIYDLTDILPADVWHASVAIVIGAGIPTLYDGQIIGYLADESALVRAMRYLRNARQCGILPYSVDISITRDGWYQGHALQVNTTHGRTLRLVRLRYASATDNARVAAAISSATRFDDLLKCGACALLSVDEEHSAACIEPSVSMAVGSCWPVGMLAGVEDVDGSLLLGLLPSLAPFVECNQSPRNTCHAAMLKQAVVCVAPGTDHPDTVQHSLQYGQKPLTTTWTSQEFGIHQQPTGCNLVVAIGCYTGCAHACFVLWDGL